MAGNFIEEFIVGLGFEFNGEEGERFKKQTQQISSALMAMSAAALAATTALFALSKRQGENAYHLSTTAKVMDTSAESLGKWKYAADRAGSSGDAVVGMLQGLRNASQDAMRNGSGPFRAFQELGVDFEGIANGSVDVTQALDDIIAKAQTLDRQTAQSGLRELGIDPVLLDTPIERLREFMEEYQKFGGMTKKLTEEGGKLDVAMGGAALRFEGMNNMLAERLIPTYIKFFEVLSEGLEWVQEKGFPILDQFVEKVGGWDTILTGLAIVSIPAAIAGLGALAKLLGVVTGGFGAAAGAAGLLAKGGLLAVAGVGGYMAGDAIREAMPPDLVEEMDGYTTRALAFLGVESAQKALAAKEAADGQAQQFIDMMDYQTAHPEEAFRKPGGKSLMDSIIGRESGGKTGLTSSKGAMGLAQLMPDTAREMAAELGMMYDKDRLLNDAEYNRTLGNAYLGKMLQRYGGNETLATAAYNAGPGSVDGWLKSNGDPRTGQISISDWIKAIPFDETRKYTSNVMADRAGIIPPALAATGTGAGPTSAGAGKVVHNTFHGLRQAEVEDLLRRAEEEEQNLMANETRDTLVR